MFANITFITLQLRILSTCDHAMPQCGNPPPRMVEMGRGGATRKEKLLWPQVVLRSTPPHTLRRQDRTICWWGALDSSKCEESTIDIGYDGGGNNHSGRHECLGLSDSWHAFWQVPSVGKLTDGTISYDEYVYEDKKLIHFHKGCLGRENGDITGPDRSLRYGRGQ